MTEANFSQCPVLYIVVPCYNEEEVLPESAKQFYLALSDMMEKQMISTNSKILFVNDGSKDRTWEFIEKYSNSSPVFSGISLAKNRGHQNALLAGLNTARKHADIVVSIDADLQDDIHAIYEMVEKYKNDHCDVVFGVRSERKTDTFFKRTTAQGFYKLMQWMGVDVIYNHADYRLMSRRALDSLMQYKEVNLFLRGIVSDLGYKTDVVYYKRNERFAGESKYPLKKMLAFAFQGISSFSISPIRLITATGFLVSAASVLAVLYALVSLIFGQVMPGWTSLLISIWFLGGLQLLSIGLIGEYIGKIYLETKARPPYLIEKEAGLPKEM
ncbi:MAG: glycosyltransferase family 2 protein [Clostridia bacterium]|nr:glycosyltransferase family 2 protein [Clostridia bacterium]